MSNGNPIWTSTLDIGNNMIFYFHLLYFANIQNEQCIKQTRCLLKVTVFYDVDSILVITFLQFVLNLYFYNQKELRIVVTLIWEKNQR